MYFWNVYVWLWTHVFQDTHAEDSKQLSGMRSFLVWSVLRLKLGFLGSHAGTGLLVDVTDFPVWILFLKIVSAVYWQVSMHMCAYISPKYSVKAEWTLPLSLWACLRMVESLHRPFLPLHQIVAITYLQSPELLNISWGTRKKLLRTADETYCKTL